MPSACTIGIELYGQLIFRELSAWLIEISEFVVIQILSERPTWRTSAVNPRDKLADRKSAMSEKKLSKGFVGHFDVQGLTGWMVCLDVDAARVTGFS
jgi:hypothetical protein